MFGYSVVIENCLVFFVAQISSLHRKNTDRRDTHTHAQPITHEREHDAQTSKQKHTKN